MIPFQSGINKGSWKTEKDVGDGVLSVVPARTAIEDMRKDYVAFTYAPMFLYGGLTHNPIQEWINLFNHTKVVHIVQLPAPVVRVIPGQDSIFDSILWMVEKSLWSKLAMFIGGMGLLDREKKMFTRPVCQELPVLDTPALASNSVTTRIPTTTIYAFGVDGSNACLAFSPAKDLMLDRPTLYRLPPREETLTLARALLSCDLSDPGAFDGSPDSPPT
jgi:hypothetical protein